MIPKNGHRPYAEPKNRRKYPPSVTTILNSLGTGDGLLFWVADITAAFAVDYPEKLQGLGRDSAYDKLYKLWLAERAAAAERGTIVHAVNEAWVDGESPDLAELVYTASTREKQPITQWQGREEFVIAEIDRYVDALEKFWTHFAPDTVGREEVVRHDDTHGHSYIGQRDWTAKIRGHNGVTLLDIKTVDKQVTPREPFKGLYFEKYRMQLAAYAHAETIVKFDANAIETGTEPAYPIGQSCILALRSDGTYQLVKVRAGGDEWAHFLRLVDMHHWVKTGCKTPAPVDLTVRDEMEEVA